MTTSDRSPVPELRPVDLLIAIAARTAEQCAVDFEVDDYLDRGLASVARRQRGLSLVELMVGIAIGLMVVAAAATLTSTQLNDNRRLLLETQVNQDLRAAMDIVSRDLRRAGYWSSAELAIWNPAAAQQNNPYDELALSSSAEIGYRYRRASGEDGPFGFKLDGQALKTRLGAAGWQELTDSKAMIITAFSVTQVKGSELKFPCPELCPDGSQDCWPTLTVREVIIDVSGQAASDPSVQRSLSTRVRLRNDRIQFHIAGQPTQACPN